MKEQKRALIRPVNNAEYAQLQAVLTNEKRVQVSVKSVGFKICSKRFIFFTTVNTC
jgi:hypothetical protein